jgi:gliding motility-associated-like protein
LSPVHIKVVVAFTIAMPNAFSPNGDGHNDLFRLKYPSLVQSWQIAIFNRWGQKVFETKDAAKGWDGTMNGMDQPEGNYVYLIRYTNLLGEVKSLSGSVILIR